MTIETHDSVLPTGAIRHRPWRVCAFGLIVSLAGTLLSSLVEFAAIETMARELELPLRLHLAAFLRNLLAHACGVLPVSAVLVILVGLVAARWRNWAPEGLQIACVILVAGVLVGWADLALRALPRGDEAWAVRGWKIAPVAAIAAAVVGLVVRQLNRTRLARPLRRMVVAAGLCGALLVAFAPFGIADTPFAGPGVYRAAVSPTTANRSRSEKPNIILIVLDTVRADRLSLYGYARATSPFLDSLGAEGLAFERALSPAIWTGPAHASLFTGLSVREHGFTYGRRWLDAEFDTCAELAKASGYETLAFSNNPNIHPAYNMAQGFDKLSSIWAGHVLSRSYLDFWLLQFGAAPPADWLEYDDGAGLTNDTVCNWLDNRGDSAAPFFLFINYMEAHCTHEPPHEYRGLFADEQRVNRSYELTRTYGDFLFSQYGVKFAMNPGRMSQSDLGIYADLYDASLRYQDDRLKELFDALRARGCLDNAVAVIVADHGEALGEHGRSGHCFSIYDEVLRVPFVLWTSADRSRRRVAQAVSTRGAFSVVAEVIRDRAVATLDRLAGAASERAESGHAVSEFLELPKAARRVTKSVGDRHPLLRTYQSVSTDRYKYVEASDGARELFDIRQDPHETMNIYSSATDAAASLASYLKSWNDRVKPNNRPLRSGAEDSGTMRNRMRQLGYVDGD